MELVNNQGLALWDFDAGSGKVTLSGMLHAKYLGGPLAFDLALVAKDASVAAGVIQANYYAAFDGATVAAPSLSGTLLIPIPGIGVQYPTGTKFVDFDIEGSGGAGTSGDPYKHDDFWNGAGGSEAIYACKGTADATGSPYAELPSYTRIIPWGEPPVFLGDGSEVLMGDSGPIEGCIFWECHLFFEFSQGQKLKNCFANCGGNWGTFYNDYEGDDETFDLTLENCTVYAEGGMFFDGFEAGSVATVNWVNSIRAFQIEGDSGFTVGTLTQTFANTVSNGGPIAGTTSDLGGNDLSWDDSAISWPESHDEPLANYNVLAGYGCEDFGIGGGPRSYIFSPRASVMPQGSASNPGFRILLDRSGDGYGADFSIVLARVMYAIGD
jgi:hypothetical protein